MLREEYSHGARGPVWLCIMRCTSRYMCLVSMPRTRIALQKVGLRLGGSFLSAMPSCQPWWHGECPLTAPYARAATIWINVLEPRLDNDDGTGWFARSSIHPSINQLRSSVESAAIDELGTSTQTNHVRGIARDGYCWAFLVL